MSAQSDAFAPVVVRRKLLPPSRTMSLLLSHERRLRQRAAGRLVEFRDAAGRARNVDRRPERNDRGRGAGGVAAQREGRVERRRVVGEQAEVAAGDVEAVRGGGDAADAIHVAAARVELHAPQLDRRGGGGEIERAHLPVRAGGENRAAVDAGDGRAAERIGGQFRGVAPPLSMFVKMSVCCPSETYRRPALTATAFAPGSDAIVPTPVGIDGTAMLNDSTDDRRPRRRGSSC